MIKEGLKHIQEKENEKLSTNRLQFESLAEALEYGKKEDFISTMDQLTQV